MTDFDKVTVISNSEKLVSLEPTMDVDLGVVGGTVICLDQFGNAAVVLSGGDNQSVEALAGGNVVVRNGVLRLLDAGGQTSAMLSSGGPYQEGGSLQLNASGDSKGAGFPGSHSAVAIDASQRSIVVRDAAGKELFRFDGATATLYIGAQGAGGNIILRDEAGDEVLQFYSNSAALYVGAKGNEGDIIVRDVAGRDVFHFDSASAAVGIGADGNGGDIKVRDGDGRNVLHFDSASAALGIGADGNGGDIKARDGAGRNVFHFHSASAALGIGADGNAGDIIVRDGAGNESIRLDGGTGEIIAKGISLKPQKERGRSVKQDETYDLFTVAQNGTHIVELAMGYTEELDTPNHPLKGNVWFTRYVVFTQKDADLPSKLTVFVDSTMSTSGGGEGFWDYQINPKIEVAGNNVRLSTGHFQFHPGSTKQTISHGTLYVRALSGTLLDF